MINVVITYRNQGNTEYLDLIDMAMDSAERFGYKPILVFEDAIQKPPLMPWILEAQKMYIESGFFDCNTVLFSPDALILKPLDEVFNDDFGIGVTLRCGAKLNNGVVFIKPEHQSGLIKLWDNAIQRCNNYDDELKQWGGDQQALQEVLKQTDYKPYGMIAKKFNYDIYNAPCSKVSIEHSKATLEKASIVHFKGNRKKLMKEAWELCKNQ